MHEVVLYEREGCHLCGVALEVIEKVRATHPFELERVDIDTDDRLIRDYGVRIPVVDVDGIERFEIDVDPAELAELVR
jgi:hypothetical protein